MTKPKGVARQGWPAVLAALPLMAGCATARNEAPPAVAEQPPEITATEAIQEGREALDALPAGGHVLVDRAPPHHRHAPTTSTIPEVRTAHEASAPPLDFGERIDTAHDHVYVWGQDLVEATDHKFAKQGAELEPVPAAPFRIGLIGEILDRTDGVDINLDLDMHVDLQLPNIEKRLRIFVTSEDLDESPRVAGEDSSLRAGLRYGFLNHFNFDVGVKLDLPPVAFASVRWVRQYNWGPYWEIYPFAKIFLDTKESFGYSAAATFDRRQGRTLLRSSSFVKWRDDRDATEWSQVFIFARTHELIVPDRYGSSLNLNDIGHGWGTRLYVSGETMSGPSYYEASLFYKKPTKNRWLYWYVEPLVRWDNDYDWHSDPGLRIGIDALFWDLARASKPR